MKGDAVLCCAIYIAQGMDSSLVVLLVRSLEIRCQESEAWCNVRPSAARKPVDGAHDALVHLCTLLEVRIVGIGKRK